MAEGDAFSPEAVREAVMEAVWEGMRQQGDASVPSVVVGNWVEEERVSHGELSVVELSGSPERDCSRLLSESLDESKWWPPLTLLSSESLA